MLAKLIAVVTRPPVPFVLGVVLAVVVLWFGGHLLQSQSANGWPGTTTIVVACAVVVVGAIAFVVLRSVRASQKARAIENEIRNQGRVQAAGLPPGNRDEFDALQKRFDEALSALQASRLGRGALYAMPWFVVIGPPGSGKTTAITESGLNFPAVKGPNQKRGIRGVGGTRNCDWWFTDQAILLDTAGRYTTQAEDHEEWLAFLGMLKKARKLKPINGVLVAFSITDVLDADEEALERHAATIRQRIDELVKQLELVFPVYLMLTKCDLLDGFVEFFQSMSKEERSQVWGTTFDRGASDEVHARFGHEFDLLCQQVDVERLRLLVGDRPQQQVQKIFSLPLQLRAAKHKLTEFVRLLTQPNPYSDASELRGVYLTSGTQEGAPIDLVLKKLSAAFGVATKVEAGPKTPGEQKSYFLRDLFTRVMQADKDLARSSAKVQRRRELGRKVTVWGSAALAAVAGVMSIVTWWDSRGVLYDFFTEREKALAIDKQRPDEPSKEAQEALGRLRARFETLWAAYGDSALLGPRRGVVEVAMGVYAGGVRDAFLIPIAAAVKTELTKYVEATRSGNDYVRITQLALVYDAFDRAYVDRDALRKALVDRDLWRWSPAAIGAAAEVVSTSEAGRHLDAYVLGRSEMPLVWLVPTDKSLLARAREKLKSSDQIEAMAARTLQGNEQMLKSSEEDLVKQFKEKLKETSGTNAPMPDEAIKAIVSAERRAQVMSNMAAIRLRDTSSIDKVVNSLSDLDGGENVALGTFTDNLQTLRLAGAAPSGSETRETYIGALKDIASLRDDVDGFSRRGEHGYLMTDVIEARMDRLTKFGARLGEVHQKVEVKLKALNKLLGGEAGGAQARVVEPIGASLHGMLDSVAEALAREARSEMQEYWRTKVGPILATAAERFPCAGTAEPESTPAEFTELFKPVGALAQQFVIIDRLLTVKELRPYLELHDGFESFRKRVGRFQAACFEPDGKGPARLLFKIAKINTDAVTENLRLMIALGNEVSKSSGSMNKIRNELRRWEVGQAGAQLVLETTVLTTSNQKMVLNVPEGRPSASAWSFLRVLAAGRGEQVDNDAKVTWTVPYPRNDGTTATTVCWLQFESPAADNALQPGFFALQPPTKIFPGLAVTGGLVTCLGKLPIHGDFVRLNHAQVPEIAELDHWLADGIERGYERLGRAFEQQLRTFVPLQFLYSSPRTGRLLHGLLLPSADQVGRVYPFTVGFQLAAPPAGTEFDRLPLTAAGSLRAVFDLVQGAAGRTLPDWLQALQAVPFVADDSGAEQAMRTFLLGTSLDGLWMDWPGFHAAERRQQLLQELWQATQPPFPPRYVITVPARGPAGEPAFWLSLVRQWLAIRANPVWVAWPAGPGPGLVRWLYDELHPRYFDSLLWPEQPGSLALHLGRNTAPRRGADPPVFDVARLLRPRALLHDIILGAGRA